MSAPRKIKRIWVVEAEFEERPGIWEPTCYVGLTREDARRAQKAWLNVGTRTRIRAYVYTGIR